MSHLTITICGCGNGAHACAALMSLKGHKVNIYSPLEEEISRFRQGYEKNGGLTMRFGSGLLSGLEAMDPRELAKIETYEGLQLAAISSDPGAVIPQASIVFVIVPAFAHGNILMNIRPYLNRNSLLVFLPSRGGLEFQLRSLVPRVQAIAFQTLPWSTRIHSFGEEVLISARKKSIQAAAQPSHISNLFFHQMEELLDMEVLRVKHMFTLTLANVGQIIHPGIMYSNFKKDHRQRFTAENKPLFYQGLDEEGGRRLGAMSDEILEIARQVAKICPDVEPEQVPHLREWLLTSYEGQIEDTSTLQKMFVTNKAYNGLRSPMKEVEPGVFEADFSSRYTVEDVPYGLLVTKSIGLMAGVATPAIDEVLQGLDEWTGYNYLDKLANVKSISAASRLPEVYGISSLRTLAD